ncbi:hypothetical protein HanIR_Chr05g0220841 [Helianthus annuus]|nr:hypothetical protein HanIR_Chr05g0220841 [Helianthus annuus]
MLCFNFFLSLWFLNYSAGFNGIFVKNHLSFLDPSYVFLYGFFFLIKNHISLYYFNQTGM